MRENYPSVSVIICAYTCDRWMELQLAMQSIERQTLKPLEVFLVIDHNPELYQQARETFPWAMVIENQAQRGLSGARNSGVLLSQGEVIAFMDEDAVAEADWIANLLQGYADAHIAGVGGDVRPIWNSPPPEWLPAEFYWVVGCSYRGLPQSLAPVRNPIGCNMSFKRELLVAAGGFRVGMGRIGTLPLGCEETELSIRVRQANPQASILYQPAAVVSHHVPEWRGRLDYFVSRCYSEGLSKAQVARYVGANDGLSSERRYVVKSLIAGIRVGLSQAIFQHKLGGIKRAGMIVLGLLVTTMGYLLGTIQQKTLPRLPAWPAELVASQGEYFEQGQAATQTR